MIASIRSYLYAAAVAIVAFMGVFLYRKGASDTKDDMRIKDHEKATTIRRRVDAARELHGSDIKYRD